MNDIVIGDLVCENFHFRYQRSGKEDQIRRMENWYRGIVVYVKNDIVSYMNHDGRTLTNFVERLTRLNDR